MWDKQRAGQLRSPSMSPGPQGLRPNLREGQVQEDSLKESEVGSMVWNILPCPGIWSGGHTSALGSALELQL